MDVKELIARRRTVRKFQPTPLSREQLCSYVEAARLAPSAANVQPLKYVIAAGETARQVFPLVRWAGHLPAYSPTEAEQPAAYIAICADLRLKKGDFLMDVGAAAENILLAALADGVGGCWMGAIDRPRISALLGLPEHIALQCVVALGYPGEEQRAVAMETGSFKYYLDDEGRLCVPKRALDEVLLDICE